MGEEPFAVPRGRLRRTLPLVTRTGAAIGGQLRHWLRARRAGDDERLAREREFHARQAAKYAELLGGMKGAMMKVGQVLSFVDAAETAPGTHREAYRTALAQLQADAPPMPPETVAAVVEEELGAPPHALFSRFSPTPMAAASIGQVHTARLPDGSRVAVKVQYPGVAEAVEADLRNTELLSSVLAMGQKLMGKNAPRLDARALAEEVRARIGEELDYRIEAANQQDFVDRFDGHPTIRIPKLVPSRSSARVLTMELVDGMRWAVAVEQPQELRNQWGTTIGRFVGEALWRHGLFNADPHPGNYLFHEDGTVTFLDFGCVKRFTAEQIEIMKETERAIIAGDGGRLLAASREQGLLHGDDALTGEDLLDFYRPSYAYVLAPQPFTYTNEYAATVVQRHVDMWGSTGEVLRRIDVPPDYVFLGRIMVGLVSVLAGLNATGDFAALFGELRGDLQV
jgi:predicted unusual protein kinase regulating ubiquinone biosynthesis (AarF/ABC1/UbiB family)